MHAFEVLGDPVRRRILDLLADGEQGAGEVVRTVGEEFGISQPAVSRHLRILREGGFTTVRPSGTRRLYTLDPTGFDAAEAELMRYRRFWRQRMDALHTEIVRGKRAGQEER